MEPHYYNVDIHWDKDRKGMMCSSELNKEEGKCIEVATPPEFPKGMPGIWSPEHLFTAAVSSCLMTTFLAIAENSKLNFTGFSCKSKGKLEQVDGKFMMSEITLEPTVTITDEKELLDFVALYGFILAPFGAIIVFEHFFAEKAEIIANYAEKMNIRYNKAVIYAWAISFGLFYFISVQFDIFLSFVTLPAWLFCGILFLTFSKLFQRKTEVKI